MAQHCHVFLALLVVAVGVVVATDDTTNNDEISPAGDRDRRQVNLHFSGPGLPPAGTSHIRPGGHFAVPGGSPYGDVSPRSPYTGFSVFARPHQPFGFKKITSVKPGQLTLQYQVSKDNRKTFGAFNPFKSHRPFLKRPLVTLAPAPQIHPHGSPKLYPVTSKPIHPFILSAPVAQISLVASPYPPHPQEYHVDSHYEKPECSHYERCQPIVTCAVHYSQIRKEGQDGCYLHGGAKGVCCPKRRKNTGYGRRLFKEPDIKVPIRHFSVYELNDAARAGLWDLAERDVLENTLQERKITVSQRSRPEYGHLQFFKTSPRAMYLARFALKNELTTNRIVKAYKLTPREAKFGLRQVSLRDTIIGDACPASVECGERENYYRTIDGSCNNLRNPTWGKALTQLQRILPPVYPDGFSRSRDISVIEDILLPSARVVSLSNVIDVDNPHPEFTLSVMQLGQFIDHDLVHVPIFRFGNESGIECCNERGRLVDDSFIHPACTPIQIPSDDPFYAKLGRRCMNFIRSMSAPSCNFGFKEQMNQITSFLDGSGIYGSMEEELAELRLGRGGLLKVSEKRLLPPNENNDEECEANNVRRSLDCFVAGDSRVNEQPDLAIIHTLWHREHNRIARMLIEYNPHWSDETTFQEARRIAVAQFQHIVYNEWLPLILGKKFMEDNDLLPRSEGFGNTYDDSVNPTILNEFATVAFRFGHTLVQGTLHLFGKNHQRTDEVKLRDNFNSPHLLYQPGKLDEFLRGLTKQPIQSFDNFVSEDLTNRLFQTREMPFGMDLVALNIQRGRDHAVAPYNDLREICGLPRAQRFEDLLDVIPAEVVATFKLLYPSVDDIDPFIAGISERSHADGLIGPTFSCIIGDQFIRLKRGDRFFYENGNLPSSFTEAQLYEIRQASWARIMCDNGDYIRHMQPLAFLQPSKYNEKTSCDNPGIPSINLHPWKSVGSTK